ncbi:hypothetical protein [Virgibacillus sp. Bac330]|uniref:hypothetical protein n=1 Tax=Virgibacillus sp. Bac330 TaxID=2419841 RepID=UPI000EF5261D|nr:hypothetical protein [Virgibacillus sp. Bac330]
MDLIKGSIKKLPEEDLLILYQDATNRIGSNSLGGDPDPVYIKKQETIIEAIQEELKARET